MLNIVAQGYVYRNPKPYLRSIHAWHPSIVRLDDGELLAAFDLGEAVEALDYRTWLSRSGDDGATWSEPVRILPDDPQAKCPTTHLIRPALMRSGELAAIGARHYRDRPGEGLVNRENIGYGTMDLFLIRSRDRGQAWTAPITISPPLVGPGFEMCHSIVELRDGRWLWPTSTWRGWNGEEPNGMQSVAFVSHDQGNSWPEFLRLANRSSEKVICWEVSLVELDSGGLLAVVWCFDEKTGRSLPNVYSFAADGKHFSAPAACGLNGETAKLSALADGRVLCLYRRLQPGGLWAQLVSIEEGRWINHEEAAVWQGAAAGMQGRGSSSDELSGLKFGYPQMVQLPDGDVLGVFWCVEDCQHVIRWVRLRVT
jgi:sialidase-1